MQFTHKRKSCSGFDNNGRADSKPTIIEAYVDPFEPPMPPRVVMEFVGNLAESCKRAGIRKADWSHTHSQPITSGAEKDSFA